MGERALPTFDEPYREIERLPEGITGGQALRSRAEVEEVEVGTLPPFGLEMTIERFWLPRTEAPPK